MDEQKLQEFLGRALVDLGGAVNAVLMSIGERLLSAQRLKEADRMKSGPTIATHFTLLFAGLSECNLSKPVLALLVPERNDLRF
jgi:hypothetical protein